MEHCDICGDKATTITDEGGVFCTRHYFEHALIPVPALPKPPKTLTKLERWVEDGCRGQRDNSLGVRR